MPIIPIFKHILLDTREQNLYLIKLIISTPVKNLRNLPYFKEDICKNHFLARGSWAQAPAQDTRNTDSPVGVPCIKIPYIYYVLKSCLNNFWNWDIFSVNNQLKNGCPLLLNNSVDYNQNGSLAFLGSLLWKFCPLYRLSIKHGATSVKKSN